MSRKIPIRGRAVAVLGIRLVFILTLEVILMGCGTADEKSASDAANPTTRPAEGANVAGAAAAGIDEAFIRESLAHLTGAAPAPLRSGETTIFERGSEEGRRAAAQYMKESFEDMGVPVRVLEFTSDERRGFNVEATLQGIGGEKHLWVTAHLDSVYNAGANDDASGLVSLLTTAKALNQLYSEHTVHFVAYDLEEFYEPEEASLVGSSLYVESVVNDVRERKGEQAIIGNLHSDMIGYDDKNDLDVVVVTCDQAGPIDEAVLRASEVIGSPITIELDDECRDYSDHKNFWDANLPAVLMIESTAEYDYYPWYHGPGDTMDKVDISYLRSTMQLIAAATALLATAS